MRQDIFFCVPNVSKSLLTVLGTLPKRKPSTARVPCPQGFRAPVWGGLANLEACPMMSFFIRYGGMKKSALFIPPLLIVSRGLPDAGYCCQALPQTIGAMGRPYALDNAHRGYALAVFREASPRHAHAARAYVFALALLATCTPWQDCHSARCSSPVRRARVNLRRESARDRMPATGQGTKG